MRFSKTRELKRYALRVCESADMLDLSQIKNDLGQIGFEYEKDNLIDPGLSVKTVWFRCTYPVDRSKEIVNAWANEVKFPYKLGWTLVFNMHNPFDAKRTWVWIPKWASCARSLRAVRHA